jgi:hypothetical protein
VLLQTTGHPRIASSTGMRSLEEDGARQQRRLRAEVVLWNVPRNRTDASRAVDIVIDPAWALEPAGAHQRETDTMPSRSK